MERTDGLVRGGSVTGSDDTRGRCRSYSGAMRVVIDSDKCQGHNRCYALAPELFDVDDYGEALVIGDGTVTPDLEAKARLAVANCPELAISIVEG